MELTDDEKRDIVRAIYKEAWEKDDFGKVEKYLADPVMFNYRGAINPTSSDGLREAVKFWKNSFTDISYTLHQVICDGDVVAANMTKTATQIAEWRGIESTGKSFQVDEMMFFRFEDDKIVEIWEVYDEILLLEQLRGE